MKKWLFIASILALSTGMQASIDGIYMLPKNTQGKQSIIEIFQKDGKYYGVGFALKDGQEITALDSKNPDKKLQNRPIRGSVFLWLECQQDACNGKIYSFDKGKVYPTKVSLQGEKLQVKIDVMFGPTFEWTKLNKEESEAFNNKRLNTNILDVSMLKN